MQEPTPRTEPQLAKPTVTGREVADLLYFNKLDPIIKDITPQEKNSFLINLIQTNHQMIVDYLSWVVNHKDEPDGAEYFGIRSILNLLSSSLYNDFSSDELRILTTDLIKKCYSLLAQLIGRGSSIDYWVLEFCITASIDSQAIEISSKEVDAFTTDNFITLIPRLNEILINIRVSPKSETNKRLLPKLIDFLEKIEPMLTQSLYSDIETIRFAAVGFIILLQSFEPIFKEHPLISDASMSTYKNIFHRLYQHREAIVTAALTPAYNQTHSSSLLFNFNKLSLLDFVAPMFWSDPKQILWLEKEFSNYLESDQAISFSEKEKCLAALLTTNESRYFGIQMILKYLTQYGYSQADVDKLITGWRKGVSTIGSQKENFARLIKDNILKIKEIEEDCPGATLWLHQNCGIRHFARYPSEILIEQYLRDGSDKETTAKRKRSAVVMTAVDDHNGAFYRLKYEIQGLHSDLSDALDFSIFEYSSSHEAKKLLSQHRRQYGRISLLLLSGHGDQYHFNKSYDTLPGEKIQVKDVLRGDMTGRKKHFFTHNGVVVLNICSSAGDTDPSKDTLNLATAFAETYQVTTIGPTAPAKINQILAQIGPRKQILLKVSHTYPLGTEPETYEVRPGRVIVPSKKLTQQAVSTRV
ncbi:hypothetical protein KBC89_00825 [Candidatus Woesebacteria bacterium]|nr:hypothetical protein [Candidatus Woesebacteria bacterium]